MIMDTLQHEGSWRHVLGRLGRSGIAALAAGAVSHPRLDHRLRVAHQGRQVVWKGAREVAHLAVRIYINDLLLLGRLLHGHLPLRRAGHPPDSRRHARPPLPGHRVLHP